jgi:hypothetical protein
MDIIEINYDASSTLLRKSKYFISSFVPRYQLDRGFDPR